MEKQITSVENIREIFELSVHLQKLSKFFELEHGKHHMNDPLKNLAGIALHLRRASELLGEYCDLDEWERIHSESEETTH